MSDDEMAFLAAVCARSDGYANVPAGTVAELATIAGLTEHDGVLAAWALERGNYIEIEMDADNRVHLTGPGAVWCRLPQTS